MYIYIYTVCVCIILFRAVCVCVNEDDRLLASKWSYYCSYGFVAVKKLKKGQTIMGVILDTTDTDMTDMTD